MRESAHLAFVPRVAIDPRLVWRQAVGDLAVVHCVAAPSSTSAVTRL
jgi:hypothetical protein